MCSWGKVSAFKEGGRPAPGTSPLPKVSLPGPRSVREDGAGGERGWGRGGQSPSRTPRGERCGEGQAARSWLVAAPPLPNQGLHDSLSLYNPHPQPEAYRPQHSPPFKYQVGYNSPKPGVELGQGRLDPPGPWPRSRGEGQKRGVLGPPLDVKALKGPGSSAPRSGPSSLFQRSQSTFTLDARPSQLLQMFPGRELSLPRRRAPLPPQREGVPLPPTEKHSPQAGPGPAW